LTPAPRCARAGRHGPGRAARQPPPHLVPAHQRHCASTTGPLRGRRTGAAEALCRASTPRSRRSTLSRITCKRAEGGRWQRTAPQQHGYVARPQRGSVRPKKLSLVCAIQGGGYNPSLRRVCLCACACVCVTVCSPAPLSPILHLPPGDNLVAMAATSYYNNNNCSPVSSLEQAARPLLPCVGIDHSHSSSTTHHRTFNSIGFAVLRINPTNEIPLNTYTHTIKRCGVLLQLRSDAAREGEVANTRNPPPQAEEAPGKSFHTNE
jgi:hypothetical protein